MQVATDTGLYLIVEIKGQATEDAEVNEKAARRWVSAVNRLGTHGRWDYILVTDPSKMGQLLNHYTAAKSDEKQFELS